jgi:hypothetical protein
MKYGRIIVDDLDVTCEETIVACFNRNSGICLEGLRKATKSFVRIDGLWAEIILVPPEYEAVILFCDVR